MDSQLTRRDVLKNGMAIPLSLGAAAALGGTQEPAGPARKIRIGIIGVGGRGMIFLRKSLLEAGVEAAALCDIRPEAVQRGDDAIRSAGGADPAIYTDGPKDYQRLLQRDDVDAVFITTPAHLHGRMAIESLRAHKWVFSEVPACYSIQEGWDLVEAAENTAARYFLAENYCFFRNNMLVLNLVGKGMFGTLTFGECGYIHDCRKIMFEKDGSFTWRGQLASAPIFRGDTYPTHAVGPMSTWLGITRGDRFTRCVSMASPAEARRAYAIARFGEDSPQGRIDGWTADTITSLLQTERGLLINVRRDTASARPHRPGMYTLQGTQGAYDDSQGIYFEGKTRGWQPASSIYEEHEHPAWQAHGEAARASGHGGGDYFIIRHFYDCMRRDRQPGIDVYDAVTWSVLVELSHRSIRDGGMPQEYPDFTRGKWQTRPRQDWADLV